MAKIFMLIWLATLFITPVSEKRLEIPSAPLEPMLDDWQYADSFYDWLQIAGVPYEYWDEFSIVAACESGYNPRAEGDNGAAKGLFQIHWNVLWADWANTNYTLWTGYAFDRKIMTVYDFIERYDRDSDKFVFFGEDEWDNPIKNIQLTLIINEFYDKPHGRFWRQWSGHPHLSGCATRRDALDREGVIKEYIEGW